MNAPLNHPLPLLDLDVLRTFVAIAETGSFTTAANAVFSWPIVSDWPPVMPLTWRKVMMAAMVGTWVLNRSFGRFCIKPGMTLSTAA